MSFPAIAWPAISWPSIAWPSLSWPGSGMVAPTVVRSLSNLDVSANAFPNRVATLDSKRTSVILRNTSSKNIDVGQVNQANNTTNAPSTWVTLTPGGSTQEAFVTDATAQYQFYARPSQSRVQTMTALTSTGLVATATCSGHGLSTGNIITVEGAIDTTSTNSRRYNQSYVAVTVLDANTFTYPLGLTATGSVTTLPKFFDPTCVLQIETQGTP